MSPQVSPHPEVTDSPDPLPAHFTPRPKQDPVGMSALFVAVTVVCAVGAGSILVSTREGGGIAAVLDGAVTTVSRTGAPTETSDHTGSIGAVRHAPASAAAEADVAAVLHASAQAASEELARVGDEIETLKSAVAEVRKDVASVKNLAPSSTTDAAAAIVDAATAPIRSEIKDLAAGLATTREDLAVARSELATVRSDAQHVAASIDQVTSSHLRDIEAINRRLGKVEDVISLRADVTAAIPTRSVAPLPRRRASRGAGWSAEETSPGVYLIKGPNVSYLVRDGDVIPGAGRVEVVRTADGQVRLLTGQDGARR